MTPQQQRIAIAESQGLTDREWICANGEWCFSDLVPNYCDDLNAMHEAEKILTRIQRLFYQVSLMKLQKADLVAGRWDLIHATARQRAEAFLRTIDKWTTNPNEL